MASPTPPPPTPFTEVQRVLCLVDLTHYTRLSQRLEPFETATFLDGFYKDCHAELGGEAGGRILKFMGDGCLAIFPPDQAADAVAAVLRLRDRVAARARDLPVSVELGANLHLARVVEGDFGPPEAAQHDVLGEGVNFTFLMGRGAGVRLSEPVYRKLPSGARSPWRRIKPPARYVLEDPQR